MEMNKDNLSNSTPFRGPGGILIIDNYDSFTYNLVQAFMVLGAEVIVHRNDALSVAAAAELDPTHLCISPGPGTPQQAGTSIEMIRAFAGRIPVLGVCLGHQAIGEAYGGDVVRADRVMHGKTSQIEHDSSGIFAGLPSPMEVMRYHSLIVDRRTLPESLDIVAVSKDDPSEVHAVKHREHPVYGVQFHPESVMTPHGKALLKNFLELAK